MSTRNEAYNPLLKNVTDSDKLNAVSEGAECLYFRLIAQSDDAGRYSADPAWVLARLFTIRMGHGLTAKSIADRLEELWKVDLIRFYHINDKRYLEMVNVFKTMRKDVKTKLVYPQPVTEPVTHPLRTRAEHVTLEPEPDLEPELTLDPEPEPGNPSASQPDLSKPPALDVAGGAHRVFEHYRARFPKRFPRVHSGLPEWKKIRDRFRDGFTVENLCDAIDGCLRSPFHQGENDKQKCYDSLELIVRDAKHVHDFMATPARAGPVVGAKTRMAKSAAQSLVDREFGASEVIDASG